MVSQFHAFCRQVIRERKAYTFSDDGHDVAVNAEKGETVPFWSSRSRLTSIQKKHLSWTKYQIREIALDELRAEIGNLGIQGVLIGVNWSGNGLTGIDEKAANLLGWLDWYEENGADAKLPWR